MSNVTEYPTLIRLVDRLRDDLNTSNFVLLFAHNGTGKTRTSMSFKDRGGTTDTLYFNAFTEDLFTWHNGTERYMIIESSSNFFDGFQELALEDKIRAYLFRYTTFDFVIDYDEWRIIFNKKVRNPSYNPQNPNNTETEFIQQDYIKISRGEENVFIWCIFLAIAELAIDAEEGSAYEWVKYLYIDDPISSLDDNNAIAIASDLAKLMKKGVNKKIEEDGETRWVKKEEEDRIVKGIISSHHSLFFNVMCNELKRIGIRRYFLYKNGLNGHTLQKTDDTPFFHHVATLSELKAVKNSRAINNYHFNALRSILEKTATFLGKNEFSDCIHGIDDAILYERALNLLSHGKYSIYEPVEMVEDNKDLFIRILDAFLDRYDFHLPNLVRE